jgi:FHA domain
MDSVFMDEQKVDRKREDGFKLEECFSMDTVNEDNSYVEFLIYKNGVPIQEVILFEGGSIGKKLDDTISQPEDQKLSRMHCKLICDGNQLYLIDNDSSKG